MNTLNRNFLLDTIKGVGIFLIVFAHARGISYLQFLLLLVPFFFLISGYLHNFNASFKEFFKKKFLRLYLPFLLCNLFFPLLALLKALFLGEDTKSNLIYILKIIITLEKDGFFFGATWFLASLFLVSIFIKALECAINSDKKDFFIGLIVFSISLLPFFINLQFSFSRTILCCSFYFIGYLCKKYYVYLEKFLNSKLAIFLSFVLTFALWSVYSFDFHKLDIFEYFIVVLGAPAFLGVIFFLAKYFLLKIEVLKKMFCFLGKNSIYILIWHFVFFRLVSLFILSLNNISLEKIFSLPNVISENLFSFSLYFSFGILGPLTFVWFNRVVKKFVKNCE